MIVTTLQLVYPANPLLHEVVGGLPVIGTIWAILAGLIQNSGNHHSEMRSRADRLAPLRWRFYLPLSRN